MAPTFNISGATIVEGESSNLVFTINLSEPLTLSQTLKYSTVNASAIGGQDYTAANGLTVTFNPGETVKTVSIPILNDNITEADETFLVNVFIPKGTPLNGGTVDTLVTTGVGRITDTLVANTQVPNTTITLPANVENLTLAGIANINGTGNGGNNILTGNSGNNTLEGLAGNDTLDGKAGTDTLKGGVGDDTYFVDSTDTVVEDLNAGIDTVQANSTYSLSTSNTENLTLLGTENINGTGNSSNNTLIGNSGNNVLEGMAGNDTLNGKAGADTLKGGIGDDTFIIDNTDTLIEDAGAGSDTIQADFTYTLAEGSNLENLTLVGANDVNGTGNSANNNLTGNNNANILTGGAGIDTLDGGAGIDTLLGGTGDDKYVLDNPGDIVTEADSSGNDTGGVDTIEASFSYTLKDRFERLVLTGTADLEGVGNSVANTIIGNAGKNFLDGGLGADAMSGGTGDDTYIVDNDGDAITENGGGGIDTVLSSVNYGLQGNLENLTLTGTTATTGAGNTLNNILIGNNLNNSLSGDSGSDTLDGGIGTDSLSGGIGNDTYIVDNTGDTVTETSTVTTEIDLIQASVSYTLGNNVENLTLTGINDTAGTGNTLNNKLTGNIGKNSLTGGGGDDSLYGGDGDDQLTDFINGNDLLDGGTGKDYLQGGVGNDTYVVDNFRDQVVENWSNGADSGGNDTVQSYITYTLGNFVENLTLLGGAIINGTGNGLDNDIIGNAAANTLDGKNGNDYLDGGGGKDLIIGGLGNDTLDGSTGDIDTLYGGLGDDTYLVGLPEDIIVEAANEGIDTVKSGASSYTISANVENLILYANNINGTGNDLNNNISVAAGVTNTNPNNVNIIDGGAGNDTMSGGLGYDVYYVDSVGDSVVESAGLEAGFDTVYASVSHTLASNVEKLALTGLDNLNGVGNADNNILIGNAGNNILEGLAGNDNLDGGLGSDTMKGGAGDDTYAVDNTGDVVNESESTSTGFDLVLSSINYALTDNVENLTLTGNANINGTGNSIANLISGNDGANTLMAGANNDTLLGSAGDDTLVGGGGNDTLVGGLGADRFKYTDGVFSAFNFGVDAISDFKSSELDKIILGQGTFSLNSSVGNGFSVAEEFASVDTDAAAKGSNGKIVYSKATGNLFHNIDQVAEGGESVIATLTTNLTLSATDFIIA